MAQAGVRARTTYKLAWGFIVVWALLALLLDVFWIDLYDRLWVIAPLLPITLWLGLVGLAGFIAIRGFRERTWAKASGLLLGLAMAGAMQGSVGGRIGLLARFYTLRPSYQEVIEAIEAGMDRSGGPRHLVERGRPLRVAFPWPGGILDNWCGVVYDPSGLVMKAKRFQPDLSNFGDPTLQDVKKLFGGDMRSCEPLGGPWYFCCFT
jgi:hypothetical protein